MNGGSNLNNNLCVHKPNFFLWVYKGNMYLQVENNFKKINLFLYIFWKHGLPQMVLAFGYMKLNKRWSLPKNIHDLFGFSVIFRKYLNSHSLQKFVWFPLGHFQIKWISRYSQHFGQIGRSCIWTCFCSYLRWLWSRNINGAMYSLRYLTV